MNIRFYNAKILVPAENHTFQITEGELWVKGKEICYIGDGKTGVDAVCKNGEVLVWEREIDAKGNLLMPGFKDAHTHTAMTFLRSYADDLPLQDWLNKQVFPKEGQLTEDDVYWLNILGIMEYLTSGITSNFDMYFFPPVDAKASVDTGFRTVQTSGLNNFGGTVELMEENYHIVNEMSDLTSFIVGFHAEYTTSKELMEGVAKLAQKLKSPVWLHNSETKLEVAECKERWGMTPTQLTDALGMYEYGGGGYHCVWFEDADFEIYKKKKLTEEEMRFLQAVDPQLYMQAARIQAMRDSLEQQLEHCKSKEEAAKVFSDTMSMVSDKDPMKEYIVAAYQDAYNEFQKSGKYQHLPQKSSDDNKSDSLVALDKTTDFLTDSTDHRSERKSHQDRYDSDLATE